MSISQLEGKTGWDRAIADAKRKIKELQFSVRVFTERKKRGEPWPESPESQKSRE
jgi:hypothetical protein